MGGHFYHISARLPRHRGQPQARHQGVGPRQLVRDGADRGGVARVGRGQVGLQGVAQSRSCGSL